VSRAPSPLGPALTMQMSLIPDRAKYLLPWSIAKPTSNQPCRNFRAVRRLLRHADHTLFTCVCNHSHGARSKLVSNDP